MVFCQKLTRLRTMVEKDLEIQLGRPIFNDNLWKCLLVDFFLIQLIIGPFVVALWRGIWEFHGWCFSKLGFGGFVEGLVSFIIGFIFATAITLFFREIDAFAKNGGTVKYLLVSRIFSIMNTFFSLLYWKGVFDMLDAVKAEEEEAPKFAVLLAAVALFIIGAFKSAAITPPIGVNLDTKENYFNIDTFYSSKLKDPFPYRILDAVSTTVVDVISAMAFYGAWGTSEDWFQVGDDSQFHEISPTEKNQDINEDIAITKTAFIVLAISHGLSFIVFITQFIFLYNHRQCINMYFVKEWDDLFYALIMLLSLFATAFYFKGWWDLQDIFLSRILTDFSLPVKNAISFLFSYGIIILMGTASYNNFGVQRESRKDEEGVLFPFFFLTYYLRDRSRDSRTLPNSHFATHDETFAKIMKWCECSRRKSSCIDVKTEQGQTSEESE